MLLPIIIVLIGTVTLNIGFLFQKSEAHKLPNIFVSKSIESFLKFFQCRKWILGTCLTSFGWILFLVAVSLAPISIIAPLNNSGIIVLALIAIIYFGEKLNLFEWVGFGAILIGVILISLTTYSRNNKALDFDSTLLFVCVLMSLIVLIAIGVIQNLWFPNKKGAFWGIASGLFGGLGAVFTKSLTITLVQSTEYITIFYNLIMFLVFQILSFIFLQSAFRKERAILVVPLFNSFTALIPVIIGLVAFYEMITGIQVLGIFLIVIGSSALFQFSGATFIERKNSILD